MKRRLLRREVLDEVSRGVRSCAGDHPQREVDGTPDEAGTPRIRIRYSWVA
jgi:hypothetical protein